MMGIARQSTDVWMDMTDTFETQSITDDGGCGCRWDCGCRGLMRPDAVRAANPRSASRYIKTPISQS